MKTLSKVILVLHTVIVLLYAISWGITIGFIKLITMCFSIKFNIAYATGGWLVLCLFQMMFNKAKTGNK